MNYPFTQSSKKIVVFPGRQVQGGVLRKFYNPEHYSSQHEHHRVAPSLQPSAVFVCMLSSNILLRDLFLCYSTQSQQGNLYPHLPQAQLPQNPAGPASRSFFLKKKKRKKKKFQARLRPLFVILNKKCPFIIASSAVTEKLSTCRQTVVNK